MAFISIFFPAIILCYVRRVVLQISYKSKLEEIKYFIIEYAVGVMALNLLNFLVLTILLHKTGNIYNTLNGYSDFAVKYLMLSVIISIAEPYLEKYFRNRFVISYELKLNRIKLSNRFKFNLVLVFTLAVFLLHFIRIFDNSFWGDEGIAINAANMTWTGMLRYVAGNGHSPFHYVILWATCKMLGYSGIVYHFVSLIPYIIILIVALTVVRKWFGLTAALILITLSSLLGNAVIYNVEVRMYSWCQLFVLLSYLMAYQVLKIGKNRCFAWMTFYSLAAVYCHYFALAVIGIIYLIVLIYILKVRIREVWKVLLSGVLVLIGFLPWILFCYNTKENIITNYGIPEVEWKKCFNFIFYSKYSIQIFMFFCVMLVLTLLYELGIVQLQKKSDGKNYIKIVLDFNKYKITTDIIWILCGVCAVFGTIVVSKLLSSMVFPILVVRYLYPSFIIVWLIMGICISRCHLKKIIAPAFVVFILVTCFPAYYNTLKTERTNDKRLESTLAATSEIDSDDYIITDIIHLNWTVSQVYYPNTPHILITVPDMSAFNFELTNWLFMSRPITADSVKNLSAQNCKAELVVENGYIGTGNVWIYKVIQKS